MLSSLSASWGSQGGEGGDCFPIWWSMGRVAGKWDTREGVLRGKGGGKGAGGLSGDRSGR